jgi:serine/threonine protein kinase
VQSSRPLIAERYRLVESLGAGGMGRVWLARDEMLRRDVAVKEVILPESLTQEERDELRLRTLREARAAARLNDANVVRIYDVVHTERAPWIVMEYVPGRSLHQVVTEGGPLPPVQVAQIGLAVLGALKAAHAAGVLHRDVKPGNVLLADSGRVVLTDFGLAVFDGGDGTVTRPGLILGSPQYISPERARDGISGPESDMWSLGATLYAAVEGRSPYARPTTYATLTALASSEPDPPTHAGVLKPVVNSLLRRDPKARAGIVETERLLQRAASGEGRAWSWSLPALPRKRPRAERAHTAAVAGSSQPDALTSAVPNAVEQTGPDLHFWWWTAR